MPGASWPTKLVFSTPPISRRRCGISRRSIPISPRDLKEVGHPELRVVPSGFGGLMRSIVGQQVSVHAARSIWLRLEAAVPSMEPADFLKLTDEQLRAVGLSGAKMKLRPRARHRHRRGPHRFRRPARARRRGGHRHADPGQGHRPVDRRDLPDVRAWPARHHARPRSRPGGRRAAPEEAAQAARRQAAAQNRRGSGGPGAVPRRCCSGTIAATCPTGVPSHSRAEAKAK